jgi:hypothetical protein
MATPTIITDRGSIGCGTLAAVPTSGTVGVRSAEPSTVPVFRLDFGFTAARVPHTDSAGSGSFGTLKLMTFSEGVITLLGSTQRWTVLTDVSGTITTAGNDMVGVIAFGTATATAHDGSLSSTEVDWCSTRSFTQPSTGFSTVIVQAGVLAGFDGTTTAKDVWLNESGTAATSDANGSFDMTGYFQIWGVVGGDN